MLDSRFVCVDLLQTLEAVCKYRPTLKFSQQREREPKGPQGVRHPRTGITLSEARMYEENW